MHSATKIVFAARNSLDRRGSLGFGLEDVISKSFYLPKAESSCAVSFEARFRQGRILGSSSATNSTKVHAPVHRPGAARFFSAEVSIRCTAVTNQKKCLTSGLLQ